MTAKEEIMLMRLVHHELPTDQAASWRARLLADPVLMARYDALNGVWQELDRSWSVAPASVPAGWRRSLLDRLSRRSRSQIRWSAAPAWVRLSAAAALMAGMVLGVGAGRLEPSAEDTLLAFGEPSSLAEGFWLEAVEAGTAEQHGVTP